MRRAFLYARVSTGKQAQSDLSIPDQLRQMRIWCERNGYEVIGEYVEPGASAMDDKRPEFQKMIGESCDSHKPCDAIVVHSLSRFFRDQISLCNYERKLRKNGVALLSITQLTADDQSGEMTRRVIAMFDEFSSLENAKHTLRAMNENARQGFHNGSQPPFGYGLEEVGGTGAKKEQEASYSRFCRGHCCPPHLFNVPGGKRRTQGGSIGPEWQRGTSPGLCMEYERDPSCPE